MKRFIFKLLLVILLLCGLFFVDAYKPFVVVSISCLIITIAMPFMLLNDDWESNTLLVGISFWVIFVFYMNIGFRIEPWREDRVALVTPFYPLGKVIAVGERADTLQQVPVCYNKRDNGEINLHSKDLYLLKENDAMSILFDRNCIILEGKNIEFFEKDYGHGLIRFCSYTTPDGRHRIVDCDGTNVNDSSYKVRMIEPPADPGYIPNY